MEGFRLLAEEIQHDVGALARAEVVLAFNGNAPLFYNVPVHHITITVLSKKIKLFWTKIFFP